MIACTVQRASLGFVSFFSETLELFVLISHFTSCNSFLLLDSYWSTRKFWVCPFAWHLGLSGLRYSTQLQGSPWGETLQHWNVTKAQEIVQQGFPCWETTFLPIQISTRFVMWNVTINCESWGFLALASRRNWDDEKWNLEKKEAS